MRTEKKEELIDLNKLSQRELLILLHRDVKELKEQSQEQAEAQQAMALKVNSLETRSKVWGGVVGFFTALATVLFEKSLK